MSDIGGAFEQYREVETGEAFTPQGPYALKVELSETSVMARGGAMVAYQGDVRFEHKGGGLGRMLKKAASGEDLRLMQCSGSGELFLANQAMLVHVLRLQDESMTVNGQNILAFDDQIEWDVTRVKGGAAGMLAGGLFNITLRGTGLVALTSDGQPMKLDVSEAPTFADPQAAIAWSGGVTTTLKTDMQAKSLIGFGSGESLQLGFTGQGWVLIQPSEGRPVLASG
ncbi:MAG: AIM24 family protein [Solirubrobacteraceae bacterium]|nr:AIM24 family protein [Solirubrobacteraceae bacterium]